MLYVDYKTKSCWSKQIVIFIIFLIFFISTQKIVYSLTLRHFTPNKQVFSRKQISNINCFTVISKVFAASLSLIVSSLVSYFVFDDLNLTFLFVLGTCLVLLATFMYGYQPRQQGESPYLPRKSAKSA